MLLMINLRIQIQVELHRLQNPLSSSSIWAEESTTTLWRMGHTLVRGRSTIDEDIVHYEPSIFHEEISSSQVASWVKVMTEEMESLQKNHTWDLVLPPKGRKIVGFKWGFNLKETSLGVHTPRYKARLVVKGFNQKEGIDYHEVFSPIVKDTLIWALLALVALYDLEIKKIDVKMAFFHSDLEKEIYMAQLESFVVKGKEDHVCLLKQSLYGLK